MVLQALGNASTDLSIALPAINAAARSGNAALRRAAAECLTRIDPRSERTRELLLADLYGDHLAVREEAAHRLADLGRAAVPSLVEQLQSPDPDRRLVVLYALQFVDDDQWEGVRSVLPTAADPDPRVRALALRLLGRARAGAVLPLVRALDDPSPAVREAAVRAISSSPDRVARESAAPRLARALLNGDVAASDLVAAALERAGSSGRASLIEVAAAGAGAARLAAIDALGAGSAASPDPVPALVQALEDGDPRVRSEAARALGRLGPAARPARTGLLRALHAAEAVVRSAAAAAVARLGGADSAVEAGLAAAMRDEAPDVREAAARAARHLGPTLVTALGAALGDPEPDVCSAAADSIKWLGPEARSAIPQLVRAAQGPGPMPYHATQALEAMGPAAIPALSDLLRSPDRESRERAAEILAELGPDAEMALQPAVELIRGVERTGSTAAIRVLAESGLKALPYLREFLKHRSSGIRIESIEILADMDVRSPDVMAGLAEGLTNDHYSVPNHAAEAMVRCPEGAGMALPYLRSAAFAGGAGIGRYSARDILASLGPTGIEAARGAFRNPDPTIRLAAMEFLRELRSTSLPACVELSLAGLKDPDANVRAGAAEALEGLRTLPEETAAELVRALGDTDERVRVRAAIGLLRRDPGAGDAATLLRNTLHAESAAMRMQAAVALLEAGLDVPEAKRLLYTLARSEDPFLRIEAIKAMMRLAPEVDPIPALIDLAGLGHQDAIPCSWAPCVLLARGSRVVRPLIEDGFHGGGDFRHLLVPLKWLGPDAREAVPALAEALVERPRYHRVEILETLGAIGAPARSVVPRLQEMLKATRVTVAAPAAEAAGGAASERPAPADSGDGLDEPARAVELRALGRALACIDPAGSASSGVIDEHLADPEPEVRREMVKTLGELDRLRWDPIPALRHALRDRSASVRSEAARALGSMGPEALEAVPDLATALDDDEPEVASGAALALGRIGHAASRRALPALQKALDSPDSSVRRAAAEAIERAALPVER
ncbi:MAG: HEAT repeat domain-containing protein [Planctomycetes bacterium]|nr:HEAT repeat domain-containing protein [Planctomycetota bacterium]